MHGHRPESDGNVRLVIDGVGSPANLAQLDGLAPHLAIHHTIIHKA